jgi:uncharacterized phiE125 gp8 family phage protein
MPLEVTIAPSLSVPVNAFLALLKVRLDIPAEETYKDEELRDRIRDAIEMVEADTWRPLFSTTFKLTLPELYPTFLPKPPVQSIVSVKYYNEDGDLTTLDPTTDYFYDIKSEPAFLDYKDGLSVTFEEYRVLPVEIVFTAGYGSSVDSLPKLLKEAVIVTAYAMYQYPEGCTGGLPKAAAMRCLQHRFRDQRIVCHL